jgi:uncharacterized membrane protein YqjE
MPVRDGRGPYPLDTGRSILTLVEDLVGKSVRLIDQKLTLLRLEVEEGLGVLLRHLAVVVIGGVVAGLGLVLTSIALSLWIGALLGSAVAGFGLTGMALLVIGVAVAVVRLRRGVGPRRLVPERSVRELEKDVRWIRNVR